ncbi:pseudouridine synthase [Leptothoe spongobia]|uniref:Pseudouridine synthase n=1 Tax=Leptothoe spongobia TAU-MAC 1115 TaxID=1967444 RepID=A0A947GJ97_9CYAN|nr:pseudouridine synthase [Leptothoe spongobia]MBT9316359.1 pseudouridine synthase [Leptothoe spongobia TAU-MAC 1115]
MDYRYLIFYKPYDVLSQFTATDSGHTTLKSFISVPDVYPVGRLDRDSEGLLLLTDDGQLQHRLCHPRFRHPRTYLAQVEHIPDPDSLNQLRRGVTIRNYTTLPAQVDLLAKAPPLPPRTPPIRFRKHIPTAWLKLTLREGKNRQVRRMTAAVGFPTLRLIRVSIGHLRLDHLQSGQWRYLTSGERAKLDQLTKGCDQPNSQQIKRSRSRPRRRYN